MGRFQHQWANVRSGHFIRFRYNGEMRVCMVISSPRDNGVRDKNLLHCLQLQKSAMGVPGLGTRLNHLLRYAGGVILMFEDSSTGSRYFQMAVGTSPQDHVKPDMFYNKIKHMDRINELYKTFSWKKCKESVVHYDNDELNEDNIPPMFLAQAGVDQRGEELREVVKPNPKTFKRKPRKLRRLPGTFWKTNSGKWGARNINGVIKTFNNRYDAENFAKLDLGSGRITIEGRQGKKVLIKPPTKKPLKRM